MSESEKQRLRRELSARRLAVEAEQAQAAARSVADRLLERREILASSAVAIYWPHRGELSTVAAIEALQAAGKEVLLPRIDPEGRMVFAAFAGEGDLTPGSFGVLEPKAAAVREAREIPVLVLPGLAFDLAGSRIGWGLGHYDRVLQGYPGFRLALAYDFQVLPTLPREAHDEAIQVLLTEFRSIEAGKEGT